jgi:predicted nucleic acid-binding protein
MKCSNLVVNASPIISLAKIGCADLLTEMFSQLVIPLGVFEEITLYSAVGKFAADARSGSAGVAIYSKDLETKQMR